MRLVALQLGYLITDADLSVVDPVDRVLRPTYRGLTVALRWR
jgi:hypothetical protein